MSNTELIHWGIKGQKWGVRRYQNPDGSLTPAGKKRYLNADGSLNEAGKRKLKTNNEFINKNKDKLIIKEAPDPKTFEEAKQQALKTGTATEVLSFKGSLTNQEMQNALTRINLERQLSDISAKEIAAGQQKSKTALEKASDIMDNVEKVRNMTEKGINVYNTIAKINNSLSTEELPVIGDKTLKTRLKEESDKKAKEERSKAVREASIDDFLKNINKYTDEEVNSKVNRTKKAAELEKFKKTNNPDDLTIDDDDEKKKK